MTAFFHSYPLGSWGGGEPELGVGIRKEKNNCILGLTGIFDWCILRTSLILNMSFPVFLVIGDLYMNSCNSCVLDTNGTLTYCKSCIGKYNDRLKNGTNPIMFDVNKKFITNEIERMGIRKVVSLYYNTYKKEIKEICKEHYNNNKEYYADYQLNYKYNITLEEKNDMIKKQDNKCLMCGKDNKAKRGLNVDHCHKTGKVRGLLCHRCNVGISYLEDKEFVSMANKYLSKYEETDMYFDREINSIISLSSV